MDSFSRRSAFSLVRMIPSGLLLLLVLMTGVVNLFPVSVLPPPLIAWAMIYYWALFQPGQLSLPILALSGLIHDVLTGFPLGLSMCGFVVLHLLIVRLRKMITVQHFTAIWASFGVIALLFGIITTLVVMLVDRREFAEVILSVMYGVLLAWIAYPVVHAMSAFLCHRLLKGAAFSSR